MDLSEYNQNTRVKALIYGPPKTGKTAAVGKLAEAGFKLHWCDLEQGIKTLLNPEMLKPEFRSNVSVINIPDHRMYPIAVTTVKQILQGNPLKICYAHGKSACPICAKDAALKQTEINLRTFGPMDILVIDSLSQLGNSAMNKGILNEIKKPGGEEYKPTFNDYMMQGALLDEVLSLIQVLDINIAVISHEVDVEKDEKKEKMVPTGGTRNFSKLVSKYFDAVLYTSITNKSHRVYGDTTYSPNVLTGSRLPTRGEKEKDGEIDLVSLFKRT